MPFSFIEIEAQKSRVIAWLFVFLIGFYFLTVYLALWVFQNSFLSIEAIETTRRGPSLPSLDNVLIAFFAALAFALAHWSFSTSHLIERISLAIGAVPADSQDAYHQFLQNIVDEVSVAIGGRKLEAMVIPTTAMNAFALEDFSHRAVIGVTEGLLTRLSRPQIEAVVAHEAGHITSGDCLSTTVTCSLAELYEASLSKLGEGLRSSRGRGGLVFLLLYAVIGFMALLSNAIRYFVSRQREYRADAISVRLTRDPLSLAEALQLISQKWHGAGFDGEKMSSIFIVSPEFSALDDREGFFADWFSTHPPISQRIAILADMAHIDPSSLEEQLKNFKPASPVARPVVSAEPGSSPKGPWHVYLDQRWQGPLTSEDLQKLTGFCLTSWVRSEGTSTVQQACDIPALLDLFRSASSSTVKDVVARGDCPRCRVPLGQVQYEGVPVSRCGSCGGLFVPQDKVSRVFARQDATFSPEVARLAQIAWATKGDRFVLGNLKTDPKHLLIFDCPHCAHKMRRQYFVYSYPVEVDRCTYCDGLWFDKMELETLQYIYENKEKFFDGEPF
jgi:heat shock protein HtpX